MMLTQMSVLRQRPILQIRASAATLNTSASGTAGTCILSASSIYVTKVKVTN